MALRGVATGASRPRGSEGHDAICEVQGCVRELLGLVVKMPGRCVRSLVSLLTSSNLVGREDPAFWFEVLQVRREVLSLADQFLDPGIEGGGGVAFEVLGLVVELGSMGQAGEGAAVTRGYGSGGNPLRCETAKELLTREGRWDKKRRSQKKSGRRPSGEVVGAEKKSRKLRC